MNAESINVFELPVHRAALQLLAALALRVAKWVFWWRYIDLDPAPLSECFFHVENKRETTELQRVAEPWTLGALLSKLDKYMAASGYRTDALCGRPGYVSKSGWEGFRRITAHALHSSESTWEGDYHYVATAGWPAYGGIVFCGPPAPTFCGIQAIYFVHHARYPWAVRGPEGDIYEFVIVYIDNNIRVPMSYFVSFDPSGKPRSCECLSVSPKLVRLPPARKANRSRPERYAAMDRRWISFEALRNQSAAHICDLRNDGHYAHQAGWIMNAYAQRLFSAALVIVTRGQTRMSFGVRLDECKSFFKDRGLTITNKAGRRVPILHWVRAHAKHYNNKTVATRMHLRGERRFKWRDYTVSIVIHGLHRPTAIEAKVYSAEDVPDTKGFIEMHVGVNRLTEVETGNYALTLREIRSARSQWT